MHRNWIMLNSICDVMKKMSGLAAGLLILGGVLELLAVTWPLESILPPLFVYPGLASIALSVIVGTGSWLNIGKT